MEIIGIGRSTVPNKHCRDISMTYLGGCLLCYLNGMGRSAVAPCPSSVFMDTSAYYALTDTQEALSHQRAVVVTAKLRRRAANIYNQFCCRGNAFTACSSIRPRPRHAVIPKLDRSRQN